MITICPAEASLTKQLSFRNRISKCKEASTQMHSLDVQSSVLVEGKRANDFETERFKRKRGLQLFHSYIDNRGNLEAPNERRIEVVARH